MHIIRRIILVSVNVSDDSQREIKLGIMWWFEDNYCAQSWKFSSCKPAALMSYWKCLEYKNENLVKEGGKKASPQAEASFERQLQGVQRRLVCQCNISQGYQNIYNGLGAALALNHSNYHAEICNFPIFSDLNCLFTNKVMFIFN